MAGRHEKVMPDDKENEDSDKSSEIASTSGEDEEDSDEEEIECSDEEDEDASNESDSTQASSLQDSSVEEEESDSDEVWSDTDVKKSSQTQEASEASVLADFQTALNYIVDGQKEEAIQLLHSVLKNPLVSIHTTTEFDWDDAPSDRLSKMARVFVGSHKNLAVIDPKNAVQHFLQILAIAPRNDLIWYELGGRCVEEGDLEMATYAYSRSGDWRAEEALMSIHFLRGNYTVCLGMIATCESRSGPFPKGQFLKKRICSLEPSYQKVISELCRKTSGEESFQLDLTYEAEATRRLEVLEKRLTDLRTESILKEQQGETYTPIQISLSDEQSTWDIMTVFCDLFDRIEAYSSLILQPIEVISWDCRKEKRSIEDCVDGMVDIVSRLDEIVQEVDSNVPSMSSGCGKDKKDITTLTRRQRERNGMDEEECTRPQSVESSLIDMDEGEAVDVYLLDPRPVNPLRDGPSQAPSRLTVTPPSPVDEGELLFAIRKKLMRKRIFNIFHAIEICLLTFVEVPCLPRKGSHDANVLSQTYRRLVRMASRLLSPVHIPLHVVMTEYDEPAALDLCLQVFHSEEDSSIGWPDKETAVRFAWKYSLGIENEELKDDLRHFVKFAMKENEAFLTAGGVLSLAEVEEVLEKEDRIRRVQSLRELSDARQWKEVLTIVERDVDWNRVECPETLQQMAIIYARALLRENQHEKTAHFINRFLSLLLSQPSIPVSSVSPWLELLHSLQLDVISTKTRVLPSLGYTLLRLTEHSHLARDWKLWKLLHSVIKAIEVDRPCLVDILLTSSSSTMDDLPTRSLRFLVFAHERLSSMSVCGQENGAFLEYEMVEMREVIENDKVKAAMREKRLVWLASNVQSEVSQCLHCLYGRYTKKRRAAEDHETGLENGEGKGEWKRMADCSIALTLPNPLPMFDDRGVSGAELVDLVQNRFPSLLKLDERRELCVRRFDTWLKEGPPRWKEGSEEEGVKEQGKNSSEALLDWKREGCDSSLQCALLYMMTLHHHKGSRNEEAARCAQYFLSSRRSRELGDDIAASAWIMMGHCTVEKLFKHYDEDLLIEFEWHIRPLRVALALWRNDDASVPFLLAQALYQVATRLDRFFRRLPSWDLRLRHSSQLISSLHKETTSLFEKVLSVVPEFNERTQNECELQWLAYFYLAKLQAKQEGANVEKVVDGLYEAACSLQIMGAQYPLKIAAKNQKHIEPVEVHYHVHSVIWKYISRSLNPRLNSLISLLAYARAFENHGVNRASANSHFCSTHPDVHNVTTSLTFLCWRTDKETDEESMLHDTLSKVEIIEELTSLCKKAFQVCTDRFPHIKAHYRLAEIAIANDTPHKAHFHIFKGIFRRRKKEDDLLESVVEISGGDIVRSDSLAFHTTRAIRLGLRLARREGDTISIMCVVASIVRAVRDEDENHVLKVDQLALLSECMTALQTVLREKPEQWKKESRAEVNTVWRMVESEKSIRPLVYLREKLRTLICKLEVGGIEGLATQVAMSEQKKRQQRKRRTQDVIPIVSPIKQPLVIPSIPSTPISSSFIPSTNSSPRSLPPNTADQLLRLIQAAMGGTVNPALFHIQR